MSILFEPTLTESTVTGMQPVKPEMVSVNSCPAAGVGGVTVNVSFIASVCALAKSATARKATRTALMASTFVGRTPTR